MTGRHVCDGAQVSIYNTSSLCSVCHHHKFKNVQKHISNPRVQNSSCRDVSFYVRLFNFASLIFRVAPQLLTTSNFIGPWHHAALLFSGLGSIVLLFGVLFSQQIREDLVRAATSPNFSDKVFFRGPLSTFNFTICLGSQKLRKLTLDKTSNNKVTGFNV